MRSVLIYLIAVLFVSVDVYCASPIRMRSVLSTTQAAPLSVVFKDSFTTWPTTDSLPVERGEYGGELLTWADTNGWWSVINGYLVRTNNGGNKGNNIWINSSKLNLDIRCRVSAKATADYCGLIFRGSDLNKSQHNYAQLILYNNNVYLQYFIDGGYNNLRNSPCPFIPNADLRVVVVNDKVSCFYGSKTLFGGEITLPNADLLNGTSCGVYIDNANTLQASKISQFTAYSLGSENKTYFTPVDLNTTFDALDGIQSFVINNEMWLCGGWSSGGVITNRLLKSSNGINWVNVGNAPWEGRHTAAHTFHDGKAWILGGDACTYHYQSDVWYSTDGTNWTCTTTNAPWGQRGLQCGASFNGKLWVYGGQKFPQYIVGDDTFYNDVWFSSDGTNWSCATTNAGWPACGSIIGHGVVFDNKMWLIGGGTFETPTTTNRNYYNHVWNTSDGTNWVKVNDAPWTPRMYNGAVVYDHKIWVLNGFGGSNISDVWYSSDGTNWTQVNYTYPARHASTHLPFNGWLYTIGSAYDRDVWRIK